MNWDAAVDLIKLKTIYVENINLCLNNTILMHYTVCDVLKATRHWRAQWFYHSLVERLLTHECLDSSGFCCSSSRGRDLTNLFSLLFVPLKETLMWWSSIWNRGKRGRSLPAWISPSTTAASTDRECLSLSLSLSLSLLFSFYPQAPHHSGGGVTFLLPWQPVACWLTVILLKTCCG